MSFVYVAELRHRGSRDPMTQLLLGKVLKGLYSAAVMFCGTMATILQDHLTIGSITAGQWFTVSTFTLAAFGGTFGLAGWRGPSLGVKP